MRASGHHGTWPILATVVAVAGESVRMALLETKIEERATGDRLSRHVSPYPLPIVRDVGRPDAASARIDWPGTASSSQRRQRVEYVVTGHLFSDEDVTTKT